MRLWFFNMCNSFFITICHCSFSWYLSRIHFHFLTSFLVIRIIYTIFLITCYHSFLPYVPWRKGIIKPLYSIQIRKVLTYEIKTEVLNIFAPLRFSPFFCAVNKMRENAFLLSGRSFGQREKLPMKKDCAAADANTQSFQVYFVVSLLLRRVCQCCCSPAKISLDKQGLMR